MDITQLANNIGGRVLCGGGSVNGGYAGDLLSHCMGKAKAGGAWFTIMNNHNVAAVAYLCEVACVVLCEGVQPDAALLERAKQQGIALAVTDLPIFEACCASGL